MKRKKTIIFLLILTICTTLGQGYPVNANGYTNTQIDLSEKNYVHMNNPVQTINANGVSVAYTYSDHNVLASKTIGDCQTVYTVNNGLITGEVCGDSVSQYEYELYGDEMRCCSIIINGERYELIYDHVGNVSEIYKNDELVCEYDYSGAQCSAYSVCGTNSVIESDFSFIGNINPFRYQGWYFDRDVELYYLGEGVFYNPFDECFVQNDFSLEMSNMVGLRSLTQSEQSAIIGLYTSAMNAQGYGATNYSTVTEAEWNQGRRWYDGVSQLEVIARCIWAENSGTTRSDDRTAEAVVIMNRRLAYSQTALQVVTAPSQFSTVNPDRYNKSITSTENTRTAKSKTDARWQQATLLACILIYADEKSDINSYYTIPAANFARPV